MTISNTPRDDDPIAQRGEGLLGQNTLVATPQFLRFLTDLVNAIETPTQSTEAPEFRSSITRLKSVQRDAERYVNNVQGELAQLRVQQSKSESSIADLERRIKNLEQTQWR